jgi:hypothetical protein
VREAPEGPQLRLRLRILREAEILRGREFENFEI